jgi:hypothetical protein
VTGNMSASLIQKKSLIIFAPLLLIFVEMLKLPLSVYDHYAENRYGLSIQDWSSWFWDLTKGAVFVIGHLLMHLRAKKYPHLAGIFLKPT